MRHNLKEVGYSLFLFGLSMILFPSIFEKSLVHHYEYPDNIYVGIFLMVVGGSFLIIYYMRVNKKDDK